MKQLIKSSIQISLIVQLITGIISVFGIFQTIPKKHKILTDILIMETIVQAIEFAFYIWLIMSLGNNNIMTHRRYIDWVITTPIMLISTVMFFEYSKYIEENKKEVLTFWDFLKDNSKIIYKIVILNFLMLVFGFLGEINMLPKYFSIPVGFIFFIWNFYIIYDEFGKNNEKTKKLFYILFIVWGSYGIGAMLNNQPKNLSYNILDIIAKNFYGFFLFYHIMKVKK